MKALITGINGFVGPYLKKHLSDNNISVVGTDISFGSIVDHKVDLLDSCAVTDLIKDTRPDYIFHLAAQSSVKISLSKPEQTMDVNVNGTKNLLDAVSKYIPDSIVLIVASADVYGSCGELPFKEDSELCPISPYGESRLEQEKLALSSGLNIVVSRSFTHTGPGQKPNFVCSDIAKQIVEIERGEPPIIHVGDITVKRDFTDVRDIVRAYLLALQKCKVNEIYNICSGNLYSIKEIIDIFLSFTDKKIEINVDSMKLRKADIPIMSGDNSKFVHATGWKPVIPMEKTLKDLLEYWRSVC